MVVTKSPLTETWCDSNAGGRFGPKLKAAGYDAVFFTGISPKPVYLLLQEDKAELRDASHLWGKDTAETEEALWDELGDRVFRIACIGQVIQIDDAVCRMPFNYITYKIGANKTTAASNQDLLCHFDFLSLSHRYPPCWFQNT